MESSRGRRPDEEGPRSPRPEPVLILQAWWDSVGPQLARVASPRGLDRGCLRIATPDSRWEAEIRSRQEEILARLRGRPGLETLRKLEVVVELTSPEPPAPPPVQASPAEPPAEIEWLAGTIPDPDLARRWVAAAARLLGRSRPKA